MAKIQSRRSISFTRADFEAAHQLADKLGVPLAQLAAQALRELAARSPSREEIPQPRPIAEQVVIDDLRPGSPFRAPCQLAGCGAMPGQACRAVSRDDGSEDLELAEQNAHQNRFWQIPSDAAVTPFTVADIKRSVANLTELPRDGAGNVLIPIDERSLLARNLQADLDARVGVLPRARAKPEPFALSYARRIVAEVSKPGYEAPTPDPADPIDNPIARSSVGAGLANIAANGLDAELEDLDQEMADHPDAGETRVVYDEEQ